MSTWYHVHDRATNRLFELHKGSFHRLSTVRVSVDPLQQVETPIRNALRVECFDASSLLDLLLDTWGFIDRDGLPRLDGDEARSAAGVSIGVTPARVPAGGRRGRPVRRL